MKKKFIAKNNKKVKVIILIIIALISLIITFNCLLFTKVKTVLKSKDIYTEILSNSLNTKTFKMTILSPVDLIQVGLNYITNNDENVLSNITNLSNQENSIEPLVYIYNTHDTESYNSSLIESYSINYNVKMVSYMLMDLLSDLGIPSYVEENSISTLYKNSNLYESNYEASRFLIAKRLEEYPDLKLLIDIHRDSLSKSETTIEIDGKSYAKILFVIGKDNESYEKNLSVSKKLESSLGLGISRGILEKDKKDGDGVYNQDLNPNIVLIEIGGLENTIEEIDNTLRVVASAILEMVS